MARFARPLLAALAAVAVASAVARAGGPDYEGLAETFRKEIADGKAADRLHAFQMASECRDPRALDLVMEGVAKEVARRGDVAKEQAEKAKALEAVLNDIEKANRLSPSTPKDIEDYNRKMKRLEGKRDGLNARLRDVALDASQQTAIVRAGVAAVSKVAASFPADGVVAALDRVEAAWAGPKSPIEDRLRCVDAVAGVSGAEAGRRLRALVLDEAEDPRVRVLALAVRTARGDDEVVSEAIALLDPKVAVVAGAAIESLRRLHKREGIEPLIAFLAREDKEIGVLREKAHRALRSLTGQKHGPYGEPWKTWWTDAKGSFVMPAAPADVAGLLAPEAGITFYGITTFSNRILFVLDVSGSMTDPAHPDAGGVRATLRRIDEARKELVGAIDGLDEKRIFNLLFFSHRVIRYQGGAIVADRLARDRAKEFVKTLEPSGGTNIHDALETAFQMCNAATADGRDYQAMYDTIFFLTDGTPTAGKIQKAEGILEVVKEWNRIAHISVHVVGVGDGCDVKFLRTLATENDGQFVQR